MTLAQYLTESLTRPFKWGEHDCTLFVLAWVKEQSGRDFLEDIPRWFSERGARRIIKGLGGLEKACDERFIKIPKEQAKDGDIGIVGESLCLFVGSRVVATGIDGLMYFDRGEARCAWRY